MSTSALSPEEELIPYRASCFAARSVVVLAPHPDDEVFGCGGALAALRADGAELHVVLVSDGAGNEADPGRRREIEAVRRAESLEALSRLGGGTLETAGFPDRGLARHVVEVAAAIARVAAERRPDLVFVPSPVEIHPDHRAVAKALFVACRGSGPGSGALRSATIAFFEISQPIRPNFLVDVTRHVAAKELAMEAFASQRDGHDYLAFVRGLNAYRRMTLPREVEAAEGYFVVPGSLLATVRRREIAASIGPSRPLQRRQPLCIKILRETVMKLRKLLFVLFLSILTTVCLVPRAEAQGGSHGGGSHGGGSHGGGSHGGGSHGGASRGGGSRVGGHSGFHGGHFRGGRFFGGGWGWGWPWWWGGVVVYSSDGPYDGERAYPGPDRFGLVETDVSPDTAEVYLDGTFIGTADQFDGSPDYLYLLPGRYSLELRHPLYETSKIDLEIQRGERVSLERRLKLLPGKGKLDSFDPPDRGTPLGRMLGPRATPIDPRSRGDRRSPGWRSDRGTDDGVYGGVSGQIGGKAGSDREPNRMEERAPKARNTRPRLSWRISPDDASVYLDDRFLGTAEDLNDGIGTRVDPGKHSISIVRPGYKTKTVDVVAKEGTPQNIELDLEK